ncbi:hypothetical protein PIB30_036908 [Stylosanthes scabra]|uniref:RNase H type-1 domain-containing protein n=1 Tax=Stylosanthes scabra TaxID=79078 RepID=A0ABU6ZCJ8_9FABA|nr:hypothetical protein [Stylosanthes scabra]
MLVVLLVILFSLRLFGGFGEIGIMMCLVLRSHGRCRKSLLVDPTPVIPPCSLPNNNPSLTLIYGWFGHPPLHFIKVNCDGSLMANGHFVGFGCILRDACGNWIGGCSGSLQENNILCCCERFAIWKWLTLAWNFGYHQVICERNSLDAFNLVTLDLSLVMEHRDLVARIKDVEL